MRKDGLRLSRRMPRAVTVRCLLAKQILELIFSFPEIALSPLRELRQSIVSSKADGEEQFTPKRVLPLSDVPTHLTFASNDERLVVSFAPGLIAIYDTAPLFSAGSGNVDALRVFPASLPGPIRQVLSNPGDLPDLVAVRRDAQNGGDGLVVEVLDVRQLQSIGGWTATASTKDIPMSSKSPLSSQHNISLMIVKSPGLRKGSSLH